MCLSVGRSCAKIHYMDMYRIIIIIIIIMQMDY